MPPRDNWDKAIANVNRVIQSASRIQQEKAKLMGALLTEELKNRSNFMWKMAEKEQLDPIQRLLYDKYKQQGGGTFDNVMPNAPMSENAMGGVYGGRPPAGIERQGMGAMPEEMGADLLSPESRSYVDITGGGKLGVKTAPIAESILKRLTDKEMRGMPLSEKEKALKARLENKVYGRVNQPKGATQYDQDATDTVYNNIVSHIENGDEAEVEADIEDLKKNFTTYQKSGVDAGTVLNKLIKQKTSMATTQPGWGDKVINFLKSFLLGG